MKINIKKISLLRIINNYEKRKKYKKIMNLQIIFIFQFKILIKNKNKKINNFYQMKKAYNKILFFNCLIIILFFTQQIKN